LHKPGRTLGCIAAQDEEKWKDVRDMISNTLTEIVNDNFKPHFWTPDSNIKKYGNLVVRKCK